MAGDNTLFVMTYQMFPPPGANTAYVISVSGQNCTTTATYASSYLTSWAWSKTQNKMYTVNSGSQLCTVDLATGTLTPLQGGSSGINAEYFFFFFFFFFPKIKWRMG
eukprot:TRINITY_DN13928_c0_g1_i1.p3 TRINITY_DN13928_c0_g1~~TRINITY_DN13928_c0_g1_i1.p3  ORF type:complete len:107 (-),score=41.56 TRINITY_DN13928_c0_g1_i1:760-1080(-)